MNDFPEFMRHPYNKIFSRPPAGKGRQGYVFDGADGGQLTIWTYEADGASPEQAHDFAEYLVVVQGNYTLIIAGERIALGVGQEHFIPKGTVYAAEYLAGTRTIHAFGGRSVKRAIEERV